MPADSTVVKAATGAGATEAATGAETEEVDSGVAETEVDSEAAAKAAGSEAAQCLRRRNTLSDRRTFATPRHPRRSSCARNPGTRCRSRVDPNPSSRSRRSAA